MKKIITTLLVLLIMVGVINAQTDFFLNISSYIPSLENYPEITQKSAEFSEKLSELTSVIPSPSEIVAYIKGEELPIDPSDVASNAYITDSPMLSFYPKENISMRVIDNSLEVFGIVQSANKKHLIVSFDTGAEVPEQVSISSISDGTFNKSIKIPDTNLSRMPVAVYNGPKPYGEFTSWVLNVVTLEKNQSGNWEIEESPVIEHNKLMYEADRSISEALKSTPSIQSDRSAIKSIAQQITEGFETDYDKALAIHDWVCSYMYYDIDNLNSEETPPYYASEIIKTQRAVCLGFATLYASLCRSIEIPCNVVSGYALGVGADTQWTQETIDGNIQNHAWNEVYAGGRWVIVDTTWDCANKIVNGEKIKGAEVSHLYFDSNLEFFSQTHKITEYPKRR